MVVTVEQKIDKSKAKLEKMKSEVGDNTTDKTGNKRLRLARKAVKRAQRAGKVSSTKQAKRDKQEENRLKNIQEIEEKSAKKKVAAKEPAAK
ncbi:MAG TPA: hypothetical protein QF720_08200 [Nitrospinota bacterium]|nr:hypothetical protein [Nitrospinota bacterium]|tara:strand:+ start:155825 stop:156100 length:276 start_codon:yes stop_codon:yes gene_type:complete